MGFICKRCGLLREGAAIDGFCIGCYNSKAAEENSLMYTPPAPRPQESNVYHWQAKDPEPYGLKVERGQKGGYGWIISVKGDNPAAIIEQVQAIDQKLREIYLGEMTAPEQAAPKAEGG